MEVPVYLFTGFLEAGKTKFIQETLNEQEFIKDGNTLLLICEEGIEEYDPTEFKSPNVSCEIIEKEELLNPQLLSSLAIKHRAAMVMIEYNGMWQLNSLYNNLPDEWFVYQEIFLCDATTIMNYNTNMRSLIVDKLSSCEVAAFNRVTPEMDRMELHKLVRGVSRSAKIIYEGTDGSIEADDIEDPLPFDLNADIVDIKDIDFAIWYRDMVEETEKYDGKVVRFKGVVVRDASIPKGCFICGRHVMTCCADDIRYSGIACKFRGSDSLNTYDWVEVTGRISIENHETYGGRGPVIKVKTLAPTEAPEDQVAKFY